MPMPASRARKSLRTVAVVAAWGWTLLAGGGGLLLLLRLGLWPLTNGWFAMFSGIAACPLLPALLRRALRVDLVLVDAVHYEASAMPPSSHVRGRLSAAESIAGSPFDGEIHEMLTIILI